MAISKSTITNVLQRVSIVKMSVDVKSRLVTIKMMVWKSCDRLKSMVIFSKSELSHDTTEMSRAHCNRGGGSRWRFRDRDRDST